MYGLEQIKEMNKSREKIYAVYISDHLVRAFPTKRKAHQWAEHNYDNTFDVEVRAFVSV